MGGACKIEHNLWGEIFGTEIWTIGRSSIAGVVWLDAAVCRAAISVEIVAVIALQGKPFPVSTDLFAKICGPVVVVLEAALKADSLGETA